MGRRSPPARRHRLRPAGSGGSGHGGDGFEALGGWRFGNTIDGVQADYVVVPDAQANFARIPAGLEDEEDVFAGVRKSARRRALWLGINLLTAFTAAWVVGLFEATIEKIVALAVLMPVWTPPIISLPPIGYQPPAAPVTLT
jgi:hypothetical protein